MRIALVSDIHGNLPALEAVLADIQRRGIQAVACLGDLSFKGPFPAECLARVRGLDCPTLQGNTELWLLDGPTPGAPPFVPAVREWTLPLLTPEDLDYLRGLPAHHVINLGSTPVRLVHGSPRSPHEFIWPQTADADLAPMLEGVAEPVVCFGHCHHTFTRRAHGKLLVGVGSVGLPFDGDPRASYAILTAAAGSFTASTVRVHYEREPVRQTARERRLADLEGYLRVLDSAVGP